MDPKIFKIFLVDDDPVFLEILNEYFINKPIFKTYLIDSGEECLRKLYLNPDIILLDLFFFSKGGCNAIDGIQILKKIKSMKPNVHVIILTAHDEKHIIPEALSEGAIDYILKDEHAFSNIINSIHRIFRLMLNQEKK